MSAIHAQHRAMTGLSPTEQAIKALRYFLTRARNDPRFAWFCVGTETFALCSEAFATLTQQDVAHVREQFDAPVTEDPATGERSDDDPAPKIQLSEDEIAMLEELVEYHDATEHALNVAAATAGHGQAHALFQKAALHRGWSDELTLIRARGKE